MLEPIRPIELAEIKAARERIAGTILRTPLVRLELGPGYPDLRLKLENLQPINAYKLRGAVNAVSLLGERTQTRRVDHQRRKRRPGAGLCCKASRCALHRGGH